MCTSLRLTLIDMKLMHTVTLIDTTVLHCQTTDPPWSISLHDESHDSLEVVSMEGDLGLLGHVHTSGVPGTCTLTVPQSLHPLTAVGRLE